MDVWISSGTHVDSIAEREEQIEKQFETLDVIFAEGAEKSTEREQLVSILGIIPSAPLLAAAVIVHIYFVVEILGRAKSKISGGKSGRDVELVRNLTSRYDIEWHEIDNEPLGKYIHTNSMIWGILNWGFLFGITALMWPFQLTVWNAIQYGSALLLTGYILLIDLLAVANHAREETMAATITNESENHDQVVVVLGEAHHSGVGERLKDEPKTNVLNPRPENLGRGTRVILQIFKQYDRIKK